MKKSGCWLSRVPVVLSMRLLLIVCEAGLSHPAEAQLASVVICCLMWARVKPLRTPLHCLGTSCVSKPVK